MTTEGDVSAANKGCGIRKFGGVIAVKSGVDLVLHPMDEGGHQPDGRKHS